MKRSVVEITMVVTLLQLLGSRLMNAQATPEALKAIATTAAVTLKYAPAVQPLTTPVSVSIKGETVEAALRRVLDAHALACVVTSSRTLFVYPRTPGDEAKYAQTVRDFTIVRAQPMVVLTVLNQMNARGEFALEPFGQRPPMATDPLAAPTSSNRQVFRIDLGLSLPMVPSACRLEATQLSAPGRF